MRKTTGPLSAFVSILCVLMTSAVLNGASPEEEYLETRDRFIRLFQRATGPVDDGQALAELEKQIETVVGAVKVEGFPAKGRINLITLGDQTGFGQVDGLRFDSDRESLFVTTNSLLNRYLDEHPGLPKTFGELSKTGDFYRRVFFADAGVSYYVEVPVKSTTGNSFFHAFLGATGQEIGPFVPTEVFVFVSTGERILIVYSPAATEVTDIAKCKGEWEKYGRKSSEALEVYRSSKLKEKKAINDSFRYREQGFDAYRSCFWKEAKNQPFFTSLRREAQSIVDRLQE